MLDALLERFTPTLSWPDFVAVLTWGALGVLAAYLAARVAGKLLQGRYGKGAGLLAQRIVWYPLLVVVGLQTLSRLGLDTSVLLGAAGVLTVAAGFAAQTSAANVISGLFLLGERPFAIGDIVRFEGAFGEVVSMDLLSVKVRTLDNLLIRVPNETLLKSQITNLSHYRIRRIDIPLRLSYGEDLKRVHAVLDAIARAHHLCLDEPEPLFLFTGFGPSGQEIKYCVWTASENYILVLNEFQIAIKAAFDRERIELPVDHQALQGSGRGEPIRVAVVSPEGLSKPT